MNENRNVNPDTITALRASAKFRGWKPSFDHDATLQDALSHEDQIAERHWSVADVAQQWGVSVDLIRDIFKDEDGVLIVGRPGTRTKRSYSTMRIPESVLERVYNQMSRR